MQFYSDQKFSDEVERGKKEFFERAGVMDEDSPDFDVKMSQFVDWFLFSRTLVEFKMTAVKWAIEEGHFKFDAEKEPMYKNLLAVRHSLFEFIKLSKGNLLIKDVCSDYKHTIKNSPVTVGFNKGDIFEARLIPHEDSFTFTSSFCFHPSKANKYILAEVKKIKKLPIEELDKARENLILKLYKMKNRFEQYTKVSAEMIYSNESNIK